MHTIETAQWNEVFTKETQQAATSNLEKNNVIYFPNLSFKLYDDEELFFTMDCAAKHCKHISYDGKSKRLWGTQNLNDRQHVQMKLLLHRFRHCTINFIQTLFPRYANSLEVARSSFRPNEITGRCLSERKDDSRLHVDAFPSEPIHGKRILRVFCNVNPFKEARVWEVGNSFEAVVERFLPKLKKPLAGSAALLRLLKITKRYRTPYDHFMLQLHNLMKYDSNYQQEASREVIHFEAGTTWITTTDSVPHAAKEGRFMLEQTFYYPVAVMENVDLSPLKILEKKLNMRLV